jgi:hypothetical protein
MADLRVRRTTHVSSFTRSDGCDGFGLGDEFAPGGAGSVDDGLVIFEDGVGEREFAAEHDLAE